MSDSTNKPRKSKTAIGKFLDDLDNNALDYSNDLIENHDNKPIAESKKLSPSVGIKKVEFELPSGIKTIFEPQLLDPEKCVPWIQNARIQSLLTEENTQELRSLILNQGQLVPIVARPNKQDNNSYEVIYGTRRLYVCNKLGIKIKALVADIQDSDAILMMDSENSARESTSAYEQGISYSKWIKEGFFANQTELANRLGITREWVNKTIKMTSMPLIIIELFKSPSDLSVKEGLKLLNFYHSMDNTEKNILLEKCREIKGKGLEYKEVLSHLYSIKNKYKNFNSSSTRIIVDIRNKSICKVLSQANGQVKIVFDKSILQKDLCQVFSQEK